MEDDEVYISHENLPKINLGQFALGFPEILIIYRGIDATLRIVALIVIKPICFCIFSIHYKNDLKRQTWLFLVDIDKRLHFVDINKKTITNMWDEAALLCIHGQVHLILYFFLYF
ncbi:hypothetical protein ACJX0J_035890 [Zea mays]